MGLSCRWSIVSNATREHLSILDIFISGFNIFHGLLEFFLERFMVGQGKGVSEDVQIKFGREDFWKDIDKFDIWF